MTRKYKKQTLTETQKKKYQRRLSHFFKDLKYKNSLQSKDIAEELEYTPQKFSALESESKPHGRFINSLEFLHTIACLDDLTLSEFVFFIDGDTSRFNGVENGMKREIRGWEKELIRSFSLIPLKILRNFIDNICVEAANLNSIKFSQMVEILLEMQKIDEKGIASLLQFIRSTKQA